MTVGFVLSGGASLGALQVGMLEVLLTAGVEPDLVVGASVGAVNGCWLAGHPGVPVEGLADQWRSMRRKEVFPTDLVTGFLGFVGKSQALFSDRGLRRVVEHNLTFERLEQAPVPFAVVATEVATGREVRLGSGPAVEAVLASAAIPGILPPVAVGGRVGGVFMDGGVTNNVPVSHAIEMGADQIFVLSAAVRTELVRLPRSALGMMLHGASVLLRGRDSDRVEQDRWASRGVDVRVVRACEVVNVSPADFSQAELLIDAGRRAGRACVESL